ncbi:MAG: DUF5701 family protein [Solirubrobacteraceae bacterium]|nr:DUF5701 family protein [Solirubrobacteraceae bacterium]
MTEHRALKQAARERAASTGEKYTQARRAVLAAAATGVSDPVGAAQAEFDRQVATLVERGYPVAAGLTEDELRARLEALRPAVAALDPAADAQRGEFGFVIVVSGRLVPSARAIALVRRRDRSGFLAMLTADELATFAPIEPVAVPDAGAYLMSGVQSGRSSLDVTPDDGLAQILAAGRSPLTIEEGIALVTQFPEAVATNGGISLAGSRCGDRRVTAVWISRGAPKLGWCWAGNPHTWLGIGSCARRQGGAA